MTFTGSPDMAILARRWSACLAFLNEPACKVYFTLAAAFFSCSTFACAFAFACLILSAFSLSICVLASLSLAAFSAFSLAVGEGLLFSVLVFGSFFAG
jgi:hypothetical protein